MPMNSYKHDSLVSIIVPVYNVEEYLEACINSLLNQSYKNIEIVLIDDGSTDNSGTICESLSQADERITVIHKENGGLSDARNVGIKKCRGELFCCVDSDDLVSSNYIEILIDGLMGCDSDISIGKIFAFSGPKDPFANNASLTKVNEQSEWKTYTQEEALACMLLQNEFDVSACGKLYKKELFENISYPVGKLYEDLATTYKVVARSEKICFIDIPIYAYRRNREGSITNAKFNIRSIELLESFQSFYKYILSSKTAIRSAAECRYAASAALILESIYISGKVTEYQEIVLKMRRAISLRYKYIIRERHLLFRRKVKIILASISCKLYLIAFHAYNR